ncbi:DUF2986 domain-containing protein [Pseudomonas sp. MN1F]|nr:DUF2986 domain-containing protein [Pseudomonas sp. MN1F]
MAPKNNKPKCISKTDRLKLEAEANSAADTDAFAAQG